MTVEPLDAVQADGAAPPAGIAVEFVTEDDKFEVHVPPPGRWKSRATRALRNGDFLEWAELVLTPEDYAAVADADPTNDDFERFFSDWGEQAGENVGKSRRSSSTSRSTPRR